MLAAHIQGESTLCSETSLETALQTRPEMCLLGDSKSRRGEAQLSTAVHLAEWLSAGRLTAAMAMLCSVGGTEFSHYAPSL